MEKLQKDLSILNDFIFERSPVGVKFLLTKPDGIRQLDKKLALCEMLKEAQDASPFYATKENFECIAGSLILGMEEPNPVFESGQIGPKIGVFDDARANRRIYQQIPLLGRNSVNYVAFASQQQLSFTPDVLIITANPSQAEIILRATSFSTGQMWNGKGTTVIGCAWLYVHPYVSGELNMMITGLYHGMKARQTFPDGLILLSIPYDLLPMTLENLQLMEWVLPQFINGKEAHIKNMKKIAQDVAQELTEQ